MKNNQIIARLRASDEKHNKTVKGAGFNAGKKWADASAETYQLRRLEKALAAPGFESFEDYLSSIDMAAEHFHLIIEPAPHPDHASVVSFWEDVTGTKQLPEEEFVQGFAEGALERWSLLELHV